MERKANAFTTEGTEDHRGIAVESGEELVSRGHMKRVPVFLLVVVLGVGGLVPQAVQAGTDPYKQDRDARKMEKKQAKAQKRYAKAQKKAEKKMLKESRKKTHYPKHTI